MTASPKVRGEAPAVPARQEGTGRSLVALTHDPALAASAQELAAGGIPVDIVEDLRALADRLMQDATAVVLLDAQALGVPADAAVDAIKNQFPDARLLVAGQAAEQGLLASRIASQQVFRFVHKPASIQRLKLLVDAAICGPSARLSDTGTHPQLIGAAGSPPPQGGSSMLPILAGVAGVVVLAVGGWLMMRKHDPAAAPAAQALAMPPRQASPEVESLLQLAAQAASAGQLVGTDGRSAAELYRDALRLDAGNAAAQQGFEDTIDQALAGAEQALLDGRPEEARATAAALQPLAPDNSRLAFLNAQVERELARLNANASQRQALEARQAQIRAAIAEVEDRIARGALVDPPEDNAVTRFREAQEIGGADPQVRNARDAVVEALLTAADQELSAGRPAGARRFVVAARMVDGNAPGLGFAQRRIDEALLRQAATSTAVPVNVAPAAPLPAPPVAQPPPAVEGSTAAAAPASGAAPADAAPVQASTLRVLRRSTPEYPQAALESGLSGWVEMEFTVAKDGSVRDVKVIDAEPARVFNAAAVTAMRRYRYEPVIRDGEPVEQRARLRMRFAPQEGR